MKTKKIASFIIVLLFIPSWLRSQETVDLSIIYKIKQEGLKNSSIEELAFWLTDFIGPRLTASAGNTRANEWAKTKMEELGLRNVRIEAAGVFKHGGWDNLKTYAAMIDPYYTNFACNPVAWTGSTNGLIRGQVVLLDVKTEKDLENFRGKLSGKIVLTPSTQSYEPNFEPLANRFTDSQLKDLTMSQIVGNAKRPALDRTLELAQLALRKKISAFLQAEYAAIILNSSGIFNVPRSNGASYITGDTLPIPQLNLPVEDAGRMERLLKHNIPVEMEIEIQNRYSDNPSVFNVIGEIPGTDKALKNEVVLLGAHIDSWNGGTGAADNASGCIVMLEAMRILKSLDISPRRTIRIALWGGEEQGLLGSAGYIEKYLVDPETKEHKPDYDRFAAYFNMDHGSGRYRGIYLQENELIRPIFEVWLKPFEDMGCSTISMRSTSGTDHLSFDRIGLPAFQFIQDAIEYGRGYHTVMDTFERLAMSDLKQNAVITASFAYNAAMRNSKLPGKPLLKPKKNIRELSKF